MLPPITAKVSFINNVNLKLKLKSKSLDHGNWIIEPPEMINPNETSEWESGSDFISGTQGQAVYEFMHGRDLYTLTVMWDDPLVGKNTCSASVDCYAYQISSSGGGGNANHANFIFYLSAKDSLYLWYTQVVDNIWDNSHTLTYPNSTTYPGNLVPYNNDLLCFYKSDFDPLMSKSDIFWVVKDKNELSWNKYGHIKELGNNNQYLTAASIKGSYILVACLGSDNHIKTIDCVYNDKEEMKYSNLKYLPTLGVNSTDFSLVVFDDKIMLFFIDKDSVINYVVISENGKEYLSKEKVRYWPDSNYEKLIRTSIAPKVIVYEKLLYLIYADPSRDGWYYTTSYDTKNWNFPTCFTKINYEYSPGLAIHNGLLKVAFIGKIYNGKDNSVSDRVIYQYCYDGTSWSHSVPSSVLSAGYSVNMATYNNKLFAAYIGRGFEGVTDNTVRPMD